MLVAFPGLSEGNVRAHFSNDLFGTEVLGRIMMRRDRLRRVDLLAGYQFLRLDDQLRMNSQITSTDPLSPLPIGTTFDVFDRFRGRNEFHGGVIGLAGQNVPVQRRVARFHGLEQRTCVLVVWVEENGPAWIAGLRAGDLIVEFAGRTVEGIDGLHKLLAEGPVGTASRVTVLRGADKIELAVVPALRADAAVAQA